MIQVKSLEDIRLEVGATVYRRWMTYAERDLGQSSYRNRDADAKKAFLYTQIIRRYETYKKIFDGGIARAELFS